MNLLESARESWHEFTGVADLSRRLQESEQNTAIVRESLMTELQLALEDREWIRIGTQYETEFSPENLRVITKIARVFRLANPLIKSAVEIQANYIFGKGVYIKAMDESAQRALDEFLLDNKAQIGNHGLWQKECTLRTDGNLYLALFDNASDGRVKVRTIDSLEIVDKYCNPDDASDVWYFKREWTQRKINERTGRTQEERQKAWYPALGYVNQNLATTIGPDPVLKDQPIYHVKVGGLDNWKFGLSEVYAALNWAKAFTMFLESWATIQESLRRIAVQVKTPGGTKAQQRIKTQIGNTTLANSSGQGETNPPPTTGAWWIGSTGQELAPLMTKNATTAPDEARQIKLQVAAATLTPEHMFGDPSTSNLATAKTLDRPTELKFTVRQELWRDVIETVCNYALARSAAAPSGSLREAKIAREKAAVVVTFPAILEHDVNEWVGAVIDAATLKGQSLAGTIDPKTLAKMLLAEIPGVENVDEIVDAMYPDGYDPEEWAATPSTGEEVEPDDTPATKRQEALRVLRKVIEKALAVAA